MMIQRTAIAFALVVTAGLALAEYVVAPVSERIEDADVIVVGTLRGVSTESRDGYEFEDGLIDVAAVLQGNVSLGSRLPVQWKNEAGIVCPRTGHPNAESRLALWLLHRAQKGVYEGRLPEYTIVLWDGNDVLLHYQRELREEATAGKLPAKAQRVYDFLRREEWKTMELGSQQSNNALKPTVRPVTALACARSVTGRPAA